MGRPSQLGSCTERGCLSPDFYARPVVRVARDLLGCHLCRHMPNDEIMRFRISETEAYDGPADKACHAHRGRTGRTDVMFGCAGVWYVYLCYGIHWMLNVVTGPENYPAAVLIRGTLEVSGPGRLTKTLAVTGACNRKKAVPGSGLWIEPPDASIHSSEIIRSVRVGVDYAGPVWANKPFRFVWKP